MATGRQTLTMAITLEGADKVTTDLSKLGPAAEKAFVEIQKAAEKAGVGLDKRLGLALVAIRTKLAALQAAGARLAQSFNNFTGAVNTFGNAVAASAKKIGLVTAAIGGAIFAIAKFAKSGVDQVDQADRQSQALGMTITQFGRLQGAAEQSSISQDDFVAAMNRLNVVLGKTDESAGRAETALDRLTDKSILVHRPVQKLADGAEDGSSALGKLGLSVGALLKLNPEQRVEKIADAFAKMADGPRKAAVANDLFGRGLGVKLIPLLNQGGAALKALGDEAERLGVVFSDADKATAALADNAVDKLALAYRGLKNQISLAFAPALAEGAKEITKIIRENFGSIKAFATYLGTQGVQLVRDFFNALAGKDADVENQWVLDFRDGVIAVTTAVKEFAIFVRDSFKSIRAELDEWVTWFNAKFGTDIKTNTLLAGFAIFVLIGGVRLLGTALAVVLASIQLFSRGLGILAFAFRLVNNSFAGTLIGFALLQTAVDNLAKKISDTTSVPFPIAVWMASGFQTTLPLTNRFWDDFTDRAIQAGQDVRKFFESGQFTDWIEEVKTDFGSLWDVIGNLGSLAFEALKSTAESVMNAISGFISGVIEKVKDLIDAIREAVSARESAGESGGGGGYAAGGRVRGAGSGTSDSILARLSNGEFVIRASSVNRDTLPILHAINNGRANFNDFIQRLQGFDLGGLVNSMNSRLAPRFAGGGLVAERSGGPAGRPVTVNFGGESFEMSASEGVVRQLVRAATGKQIRSNGRKPAWYGA